eukprot:3771697-Alexandrium_andersonii.AAC.1
MGSQTPQAAEADHLGRGLPEAMEVVVAGTGILPDEVHRGCQADHKPSCYGPTGPADAAPTGLCELLEAKE